MKLDVRGVQGERRSRLRIVVWICCAVLALVVLMLVGRAVGRQVPRAEAWLEQQGAWAPVVYVLGSSLLMTCFLSVDVLSFAGGVMFGLGWGFLYAYGATLLSSVFIFYAGRRFARRHVEKLLRHYPVLARVDELTQSREGLRMMLLLRLCPLPFAPVSYLLSTTRVSLRMYLVACLGIIPTSLLNVYCGFVAHHMTRLASGHGDRETWHYLAMVSGLLLAIGVVMHVARRAYQAVQQAAPAEQAS